MIAAIDLKLSAQLDEILHAEAFQALESGLARAEFRCPIVSRFRQNIRIEMLNCFTGRASTGLRRQPCDFQVGLYKHIYSAEFGQFGGKPYGAVISCFAFSAAPQDVKLMQFMSRVGAISHAPSLPQRPRRCSA